MTVKLKKIIAKEGLVVVLALCLSVFTQFIFYILDRFCDSGIWLGAFSFIYIILRFIFWAIKALKEK